MFFDGKKIRKVAAYCRVSTDRGDQKNSFESQKEYFIKYIGDHPEWTLSEIYTDEGITGTNTKKRKDFLRMMEDAQRHRFDLLITKEISRFARNLLDSIYYTRELKRFGIGVYFLNDNLFTLDNDAELRLAILASIAQEESRRTSERVKWGQKQRMEKGVVFGRSLLGYDVKNGKMTVNPEGASVVRMIFHAFTEENLSVAQITERLNREKIPPMYSNKWNASVVLRILKNEKYCGDLKQKKTYTPDYLSHEKKINHGEEEFVILKNHHEPIISQNVFEKAQNIFTPPYKMNENGGKYPFSGKIICGICGKSYTARFQKSNGKQYHFWRCNSPPHPNKRALHTEDLIEMLAALVDRLYDIQTKDENELTNFFSHASIADDTITFWLFHEHTPFSFRFSNGIWKEVEI